MATRAEVYVDTSTLISFVDRSDNYHHLFLRLFARPPRLFTSALVVAEGHGWCLRRYDQDRALQFLAMLECLEPLEILAVGPADLQGSAGVLRRFSDQRLTLTDAVGLHLMTQRRVRACWSTDFHLGLTGVPLAIHGEGRAR